MRLRSNTYAISSFTARIRVVVRYLALIHPWLLWSFPAAIGAELPSVVDYNFHIRPMLSDRCYKCHGPDERARQADLRLDRYEDALTAVDDDGAIIHPGAPDKSELYHRVASTELSERMPPVAAKLPPLSEYELALLRRWIAQGSQWKQHWAFIPLAATEVPPVNDESWPSGRIDHFVLSQLEKESLEPSPRADRNTLLRRVSFDLTGLPPTPKEIEAFLADQSRDAFERVVDRLLASPRYGERMATYWLDLSRYSDTFGYQVDRDRRVWPWRDWVIDAFNENLPFDQFITWQLAGDLLPDATDEQILATTFNRLHPQKVEGGSTPEEFRVEYVADRTHTLATGLMGLTLECARCHDHKYDPITQKEYYQLFAFFNNIDEAGLYSYFTSSTPTPTLLLADAEAKQKLIELDQGLGAQRARLERIQEQSRQDFAAWLSQRPTQPLLPDLLAHFPFDRMEEGKLTNLADADAPATSGPQNRVVPGRSGSGMLLTGDDPVSTNIGNFTRHEPFTVALWIQTPDVKERAVVLHRSRAWTDAGSRGYQLLIEEGQLSVSLIHFWPGNAIRVRTKGQLPTGTWHHVAFTYDGSSRAEGLDIYVDGARQPVATVRNNLNKPIQGGGGDHITIGERFRDRGFKGGMIDELQVFGRQLTSLEISQLFDGKALQHLLELPAADLSDSDRAALFAYYLSTAHAEYRAQLAKLAAARQQRGQVSDPIPEIMVMRELAARRPTYVLDRGAYDRPTELVQPDTPAALPPFPFDQPRNRFGLARWLTDPAHPLTARVTVNQLWQLLFGEGLVRTTEDFGSQGELPSHPELLDWLARDFMNHDWDIKRLIKSIVMSSTYQQSSTTDSSRTASANNRLLARGPRHRLPAEMIRDNALAASGLLVDRMGGEPARPYEVAVSFKPVDRGTGDALYRRSVYTYWKRTGPAPVMMTLDAAKRDVCSVKREKTSTPLQALALLNDPQMTEAARILGQQLVEKHGDDTETLVTEMFLLLTSRRPEPRELEILAAAYRQQLEHFLAHPDLAAVYLKNGDAPYNDQLSAPSLATAGVLANMLLNYDACIVKR